MSPLLGARLERTLVILIAAHSYAVGLVLLFATRWALDFGGWGAAGQDLFFPRQGGAFHIVLATGYLLEYFHHRGVLLLVTAKIFAAVFLTTATAFGEVPWAVPLSGVTDALMGLAVFAVRRANGRTGSGAPLA